MEKIQRDKFRRNKELRDKLMTTGNRSIINTLDGSKEDEFKIYWGVLKNGTLGENKLGEILEKVRGDLMNGSELEKWMTTCFPLISTDNKKILPKIVLTTFKDG